MSVVSHRTIHGADGRGRSQITVECDGPDCGVRVTTSPLGTGEELLPWPTVDLADEDFTRLWFHCEACHARWAAKVLLGLTLEGSWHGKLVYALRADLEVP